MYVTSELVELSETGDCGSSERKLEVSVINAGTVDWVNLAWRVLFESTRRDDLEAGQIG